MKKIEKEPLAPTKSLDFKPFVPTEMLKACALICLHLMAAEGASGSSGGQSRDLGDAWRNACPRSPGWDSDVDFWTVVDGAPRCEVYEHNSECGALEVIGQDWSGEVVSLFIEDWELGRVALSCHMALDLLCQDMRDACQDSSASLGSPCSLCSQCWKILSQRNGRSRNAVGSWLVLPVCERTKTRRSVSGRPKVSKEGLKVSVFVTLRFPSSEFCCFLCIVGKSQGGLRTTFRKRDEGFLSFSAVCCDFFQAIDVPALIMRPCGRGATTPASQNHEKQTNTMMDTCRSHQRRSFSRHVMNQQVDRREGDQGDQRETRITDDTVEDKRGSCSGFMTAGDGNDDVSNHC